MTEDRMVATADGALLWTACDGDGDLAVILTSGGPGCCDYLEPVAMLMAAPERRIIRWDPRGIGRSGGDPDGPFTVDSCLADLEAIRQAFAIERWVVCGHSWGADLSIIYALAHPERCLELIGIAGGRLNNDRDWHAAYRQGIDEGRETQPAFAYPLNMVANAQLNTAFKHYLKRPTLFREVAQLAVPARFIYGSDDIRPSWPVEQVAALMPVADFISIDGGDHFCYRSHPDEVRRAIESFLASVGDDSGSANEYSGDI